MKTLDEVIFEAPYSLTPWEADALHYLKEFQGLSKMWNDKLDKEQANPALTWDELRMMEGEPVWVEEYDPIDDNKGWHRCKWYLVNFVNDEYFYVCDNDGEENHFCLAEIGKTWTAYRKERE